MKIKAKLSNYNTLIGPYLEILVDYIEIDGKPYKHPEPENPVFKGRWRAKEGEDYFYLDSTGYIHNFLENNDKNDNSKYKIGNYYQTKELAQKALDRQILIQELYDRAEKDNFGSNDKSFKYQLVFLNGWIPYAVEAIFPNMPFWYNFYDLNKVINEYGSKLDLLK